jgi:hypothetical protein
MVTMYKETITRAKGADWNIDHTVTQTDANGAVTPVTGLSAAAITSTIRHRDTGAQLWQGTRAGGEIVVTDDAAGAVRIAVPSTATDDLEQRLYDMDLWIDHNNAYQPPKRWFVQVVTTATIP